MEHTNRTNPGASIRRLRLELVLTQRELAQRAGMSPITLSEIERGRNTTVETLEKIAEALEVGVNDLFSPAAVLIDDVPKALRQLSADVHVAIGQMQLTVFDQIADVLRLTRNREQEMIDKHREAAGKRTLSGRAKGNPPWHLLTAQMND